MNTSCVASADVAGIGGGTEATFSVVSLSELNVEIGNEGEGIEIDSRSSTTKGTVAESSKF